MTEDVHGRLTMALFVLGLMARLACVFVAGSNALAWSDDAKAYHDLAINLVGRHRFVTTVDPPHRLDAAYAQRPPLTPLTLAAVYFAFGPHLLAGQIVLVCIGALAVVGVAQLGRELFSPAVGLVAGVLAAVYPLLVFLAALPLTESLAVPLYVFLALALTRSHRTLSWSHTMMAGSLLGLAALNRPQIIGLFPLLIVLAFVPAGAGSGERLRHVGTMLALAVAVTLPWTIRNYVVLQRWVPVSFQAGVVLYQGNNPYTETALTGLRNRDRGWHLDPRWAEQLAGLSPGDADREALRLALAFIREHPSESLRYSAEKLGIFLSPYDHPADLISWYPILALSILGFLWTGRRWRELLSIYLLIAQTVVTAAVFTAMPRFRAPVTPFFLLMAAVALCRLWERAAGACRTTQKG